VALSGLLLDRVGRKPVLVMGLACMTAGLIGIATAPSLGIALAWTFLLGLGWGCQDVTLNVFVADLYPEDRNAALNLTNVFFGLGALAGPLAVGAALTTLDSPQPVLLLLAGLAALAVIFFLVLRFPPMPAAPQGTSAGRRALGVLREGYVLLTALMFFLYVGLEIGFGGWAYSFAIEGAHLDAGIAALVVSVYWIAFTVGRAAAGFASRRWPGAELVWGGALCGAAGAGVLALFPASPAVLFGIRPGCGALPGRGGHRVQRAGAGRQPWRHRPALRAGPLARGGRRTPGGGRDCPGRAGRGRAATIPGPRLSRPAGKRTGVARRGDAVRGCVSGPTLWAALRD
jgi:predicted MFS family arabinose efflux permease